MYCFEILSLHTSGVFVVYGSVRVCKYCGSLDLAGLVDYTNVRSVKNEEISLVI